MNGMNEMNELKKLEEKLAHEKFKFELTKILDEQEIKEKRRIQEKHSVFNSHVSRGLSLMCQGYSMQAIKEFEESIRLGSNINEDTVHLYDNIGDCWLELGDFINAYQSYKTPSAINKTKTLIIEKIPVLVAVGDLHLAEKYCNAINFKSQELEAAKLNKDYQENAPRHRSVLDEIYVLDIFEAEENDNKSGEKDGSGLKNYDFRNIVEKINDAVSFFTRMKTIISHEDSLLLNELRSYKIIYGEKLNEQIKREKREAELKRNIAYQELNNDKFSELVNMPLLEAINTIDQIKSRKSKITKSEDVEKVCNFSYAVLFQYEHDLLKELDKVNSDKTLKIDNVVTEIVYAVEMFCKNNSPSRRSIHQVSKFRNEDLIKLKKNLQDILNENWASRIFYNKLEQADILLLMNDKIRNTEEYTSKLGFIGTLAKFFKWSYYDLNLDHDQFCKLVRNALNSLEVGIPLRIIYEETSVPMATIVSL